MSPAASLDLIGAVGYLLAGLLLLGLGLLMLTTWRGRMQGGLLLTAILVSASWAGAFAAQALWQPLPMGWLWALEALRNLAWLWFLLGMLRRLPGRGGVGLRLVRVGVLVASVLLLLPLEGASVWLSAGLGLPAAADPRLLLLVLLAVCGLFLIEQLYRGTPWQHRWGIKFLCLGLGGMFVFDFFFFADALLFARLDHALWLARGPINVLVVPLLAVSVARNPQWSFDLSLSRAVVYHSTALAAAGVYLLFMALAGYYIREFGGEWSAVFQPLFLFGAGLLLAVLLFSGHLRSRLKLFVSRHFYSYRYDYRAEWLHLISVLSGKVLDATLPERVIFALGELVESPGGCLWRRDDDGVCRFARCWNLPEQRIERGFADPAFDAAIARLDGIIDLSSGVLGAPGAVVLPAWLVERDDLWLLVPLPHEERLEGFLVLAQPRAPHRHFGWENIELLRTAARQAASYLALEAAAQSLAEAEQFRGFNRLSAFVVHDLKNLIAQLSLVTRNAERHRHNPAFVDDALQTVANAVDKMSRLLTQLRTATVSERRDLVALPVLLEALVRDARRRAPPPVLLIEPGPTPTVCADRDRLGAVITNIIHNAQDATPQDGRVEVRLSADDDWVRIEVTDTGCGMDERFLRERLFRPFDSTKGLAGMGIGAYECREFMHLLGGRVEVESQPGAGTRFRLVAPAASAERPAEFLVESPLGGRAEAPAPAAPAADHGGAVTAR